MELITGITDRKIYDRDFAVAVFYITSPHDPQLADNVENLLCGLLSPHTPLHVIWCVDNKIQKTYGAWLQMERSYKQGICSKRGGAFTMYTHLTNLLANDDAHKMAHLLGTVNLLMSRRDQPKNYMVFAFQNLSWVDGVGHCCMLSSFQTCLNNSMVSQTRIWYPYLVCACKHPIAPDGGAVMWAVCTYRGILETHWQSFSRLTVFNPEASELLMIQMETHDKYEACQLKNRHVQPGQGPDLLMPVQQSTVTLANPARHSYPAPSAGSSSVMDLYNVIETQ